ncbi:MAG: glycosidase [Candidatus Eremiobacteraeota bacterium]|nr:glycosidase [Candidatus Eremiobacteraeota bacterium]
MEVDPLESLETTTTRLGVVLEPSGDPSEVEGVLNPASARTRDGKLLLYPRAVGKGNTSTISIAEAMGAGDSPPFTRVGIALEPTEPYELRDAPGGYGCEDPRVTFVPLLDAYVMAYTAFGPFGPRIALALSHDARAWEWLGLVDFEATGLPHGDDKDGVFFPEPVLSPNGVPSFAFYHRPMVHVVAVDVCAAVPIILAKPPGERESTRIAYVPLEAALEDRKNLLKVAESALVLEPGPGWGEIKNGGGTPPVRIDEGWMSVFHGVDGLYDSDGRCTGMRYSAGIVVHDYERPHIVRYRSAQPVFFPETADERRGMVNNVVFPTAIDVPRGAAPREYDIYYGMADSRIGRLRMGLGASVEALSESRESAA